MSLFSFFSIDRLDSTRASSSLSFSYLTAARAPLLRLVSSRLIASSPPYHSPRHEPASRRGKWGRREREREPKQRAHFIIVVVDCSSFLLLLLLVSSTPPPFSAPPQHHSSTFPLAASPPPSPAPGKPPGTRPTSPCAPPTSGGAPRGSTWPTRAGRPRRRR